MGYLKQRPDGIFRQNLLKLLQIIKLARVKKQMQKMRWD